nr:hypothetical protein [Streptomyces sp. DHE17-7]
MQFVGLLRVAGLDPVGGDGLHDHEADVVGDDVVQFPGDARAFLHDGGTGFGELFTLQRLGALQRLILHGGPGSYQPAEGPGRGRQHRLGRARGKPVTRGRQHGFRHGQCRNVEERHKSGGAALGPHGGQEQGSRGAQVGGADRGPLRPHEVRDVTQRLEDAAGDRDNHEARQREPVMNGNGRTADQDERDPPAARRVVQGLARRDQGGQGQAPARQENAQGQVGQGRGQTAARPRVQCAHDGPR